MVCVRDRNHDLRYKLHVWVLGPLRALWTRPLCQSSFHESDLGLLPFFSSQARSSVAVSAHVATWSLRKDACMCPWKATKDYGCVYMYVSQYVYKQLFVNLKYRDPLPYRPQEDNIWHLVHGHHQSLPTHSYYAAFILRMGL